MIISPQPSVRSKYISCDPPPLLALFPTFVVSAFDSINPLLYFCTGKFTHSQTSISMIDKHLLLVCNLSQIIFFYLNLLIYIAHHQTYPKSFLSTVHFLLYILYWDYSLVFTPTTNSVNLSAIFSLSNTWHTSSHAPS